MAGAGDEEYVRVFEPGDVVPPYQILSQYAKTAVDWATSIRIKSRPYPFLKTSIMATIGPSCMEVPTIEAMIEAGMTVCRLNLSANDHEAHIETLNNIRTAIDNYSKRIGYPWPVAIAIDTKGPTIHTGYFDGDPEATAKLEEGQSLKLTTDKAFSDRCTSSQIYVDYEHIQKVVSLGSKVFLDKGIIRLVVTHVQGNVLTTKVEIGGILGGRKLVNLPGTDIDLPNILEREKEDILFAVKQKVDIILMSFVRSGQAIREMREFLGEEGKDILIFAKIQNQQGINQLSSIILESDGIVLIRGIMNIEISQAKILQLQKYVVVQANLEGKPCVISSQFMAGMREFKRPMACQATDLSYIVNDGAHCIMLNSVTAIGCFPVETVALAAKICKNGEAVYWQRNNLEDFLLQFEKTDDFYAAAIAASKLAFLVHAAAIIVITTSGKTAFTLSQFQPHCGIIAITTSETVARQCMIRRAIIPMLYKEERKSNWRRDIQARIVAGIRFGKIIEIIKTGDPIVIVAPTKTNKRNNVQLKYATVIPEKIFT